MRLDVVGKPGPNCRCVFGDHAGARLLPGPGNTQGEKGMYLAHFGQRARPENARRLLVRIVPVCQTRAAVGRIFADTYSAYTLSRVDVHATSRRAWEGRVLRAGAGALGWCMLGALGLVLLARPVIAGVLTVRAISRRDGSVRALKVFALAGLFGMAVPRLVPAVTSAC